MAINKRFLIKFLFFAFLPSAYAAVLKNEPIFPIPDVHVEYPKQVELGRVLFNDVQLSRGNQVSCASCHALSMGGADGQVVSTGIRGQKGALNSPSIFNTSLQFRQFWNGRAKNLLEQIDGPVSNPKEMGSSWEQIEKKLQQDMFYVSQFNQIYSNGLTILNIKKAMIAFEQSLLTPNSRFDQYLRGNDLALTLDELKGYRLFKKYGCISCHQGMAVGGNLYQKMGVMGDYFADKGQVSEADYGRFLVTGKENDRFVYKVPSLRNIELTAPYFHDGSEASLENAVILMMKYQLGRVAIKSDVKLIVKFLKTLTGQYQGIFLKGL